MIIIEELFEEIRKSVLIVLSAVSVSAELNKETMTVALDGLFVVKQHEKEVLSCSAINKEIVKSRMESTLYSIFITEDCLQSIFSRTCSIFINNYVLFVE